MLVYLYSMKCALYLAKLLLRIFFDVCRRKKQKRVHVII